MCFTVIKNKIVYSKTGTIITLIAGLLLSLGIITSKCKGFVAYAHESYIVPNVDKRIKKKMRPTMDKVEVMYRYNRAKAGQSIVDSKIWDRCVDEVYRDSLVMKVGRK